jgi:hypothetical protein
MARKRIALAFALGLAGALAACGENQAQKAAREATEVTVESAPQAGGSAGESSEATVESAKGGEESADE